MAKLMYCWRCMAEIPMLEEHEWEEVEPLLVEDLNAIKRFRHDHAASLAEAQKQTNYSRSLKRYLEITGVRETNINALWHHRAALYGPPCAACGKPLRTPRASFCAECGAPRSPIVE